MAVIGKIRKRTGLLITIIAVAILGFLLMDTMNSQTGIFSNQQTHIGSIDGQKIDQPTFERIIENRVREYKIINGGSRFPVTDEIRRQIRNEMWGEMVENSIYNDLKNNLGLQVTDEEMVDMFTGSNPHPAIVSAPVFQNQQTGQFDPGRVSLYISQLDQDDPGTEPGTKRIQWTSFERNIKLERRRNKYSSLISKGLYVPSWAAKMKYKEGSETVDFNYVFLPYSSIDDAEVEVTDADIQNFLQENKSRFQQDPSRKIKYAFFEVKPSPADSAKALRWMNEKLNAFANAKDDSMYVKLNSDLPFSNAFLQRDEITIPFADSLFNMETGQLLGPFQDRGYYKIAKVVERKKIADSVQIKEILFDFRNIQNQEEANAKLKLIDSVFSAIDSLGADFSALARRFSDNPLTKSSGGDAGWVKIDEADPALKKALFENGKEGDVKRVLTPDQSGWRILEIVTSNPTNDAIQVAYLTKEIYPSESTERNIYEKAATFASKNRTAEDFDANESGEIIREVESLKEDAYTIPGLGQARELVRWAYKGEKGAVSSVLTVDGNHVVALLADVTNEGLPTVDQIRTQVEAEVKRNKKAKMLTEKLSGKESLEEVASTAGTTVQTATGLSLNNASIPGAGFESAVVATAVALDVEEVSAPVKGNTGVYRVQTTAKNPAPEIEDYTAYKSQIKTSYNSRVASGLTNAIKELADVEDNRFSFY